MVITSLLFTLYQNTERNKKLEDITSTVLEELTSSCDECRITSDIIDKPSFACYPESPTYVTYRARLEGTSETDSGSLISLIQDWVSGGTSIIVTGVLMTVDSECSVAISSLNEGECSPTQPPTTDPITSSNVTTTESTTSTSDTAAIIGGVVAIILIIAITVVILAIVALILKNRHGDISINKSRADK